VTAATVSVHKDGDEVHIAVAGELDLANAGLVEDEIVAAIDNTATNVVVDLTDLLYMDSSGLRILFTLSGRLEVLQIEMSVVAPHGSPTRRVIEMSGFDSLVELRP